MYEFAVDTSDKPTLYRDLIAAADALTAGEPDPIANMANVAALLWQYLPGLNWAGFYRARAGEYAHPQGRVALQPVLADQRAELDVGRADLELLQPSGPVAQGLDRQP